MARCSYRSPPFATRALVVPLIAEAAGRLRRRCRRDRRRASVGSGPTSSSTIWSSSCPTQPGRSRELLAAAPALRIVATSREPLRIAGESEFDLPPMDEGDAVTLFIERAQAVRADVGDSPAVHELIRRLDGLPLAIELAAARVKLLGPEQLLERIAQRLDLLKGGRDADERHATLRATIGWSYDLLDDEEQRLFARLAVFRGGCTLDAAEAVCDADLDTLASLLDKSLAPPPHRCGRGRALLDARDDPRVRIGSAWRPRVRRMPCDGSRRDWLLELADRAGTRGTVGVAGKWDVDLVAPEVDNVRAVLEWAARARPRAWPRSGRVARGILARSRSRPKGRHVSSHCSHGAADAEPELRAHALRALGGAFDISGEPERAAPCYRQSLELFVASGDEIQAANLRYRVAANMVNRGRDGRRLAAARGSTPDIPAARPSSRRGAGTRIPAETGRTETAICRSRSSARWRAPPSPTSWAGNGGRQAGSTVPPRSSASSGTSRPRRIMPSGRSSSLWASVTGGMWCSQPPSWRFSPQNARTPRGRGVSGAPSRAR